MEMIRSFPQTNLWAIMAHRISNHARPTIFDRAKLCADSKRRVVIGDKLKEARKKKRQAETKNLRSLTNSFKMSIP